MPAALITLTTDFGDASPYAAAVKGVILGVNPRARLVDLGHRLPPQDVRHAAHFLAGCVPFFPPGTLHVVVVDPGVGTGRALLYVEAAGQRLLAPDNGVWTLLPGAESAAVIRLEERRFWRPEVSRTFHGRDVLAPVAARLSLGADPRELGPATTEWVRLEVKPPAVGPGRAEGEVTFVDDFGNLITNLPGGVLASGRARVTVGGQPVERVVATYGEAGPGELVALVSSCDTVEVAVVRGNAARRLGARAGAAVVIQTL